MTAPKPNSLENVFPSPEIDIYEKQKFSTHSNDSFLKCRSALKGSEGKVHLKLEMATKAIDGSTEQCRAC